MLGEFAEHDYVRVRCDWCMTEFTVRLKEADSHEPLLCSQRCETYWADQQERNAHDPEDET